MMRISCNMTLLYPLCLQFPLDIPTMEFNKKKTVMEGAIGNVVSIQRKVTFETVSIYWQIKYRNPKQEINLDVFTMISIKLS